jgi:phosphoglycerate dehydrogenase-like enzyme
MNVLYYDVHRHKNLELEHGWMYADLDLLLRDSDFVTLHCPLTPELHHLIGGAELRAMRPTAFLINTARGGLVDEVALAQALREGWIAGAACDAFAQEPPLGSPLLALDNFIATPHTGATTHEAIQRVAMMAAQNTVQALRGQRPLSLANPEVYSR